MTHYYGGLVGPVLPAVSHCKVSESPRNVRNPLMAGMPSETSPQRILPGPQIPQLLRPRTNPSRAQPAAHAFDEWRTHITQGGYQELRSPAEMRKLLKRKVREQNGICAICHREFIDYNDIVPDHRDPKGMGALWRDDHPDNIQANHGWCNGEKGSTRMDD
jgi:hypothetical protein